VISADYTMTLLGAGFDDSKGGKSINEACRLDQPALLGARPRVFVKAIKGELADWGVGKLLSKDGPTRTVEYFDAPMLEPVLRECSPSELGSVLLPAQTRVYAFDTNVGAWEIGRIIDDHGDSQLVKFPNGKALHLPISSVFVRWDRSIEDPTSFLAAGISETPRFADGRGPFVRTLLQQRSAALGMSALPSSAIDLEAHQIEVARRVLQDPVTILARGRSGAGQDHRGGRVDPPVRS